MIKRGLVGLYVRITFLTFHLLPVLYLWRQNLLRFNRTTTIAVYLSLTQWSNPGGIYPCRRRLRIGIKVGQIRPEWDKSGTFLFWVRIQLELNSKNVLKSDLVMKKSPNLSHLACFCPVSERLGVGEILDLVCVLYYRWHDKSSMVLLLLSLCSRDRDISQILTCICRSVAWYYGLSPYLQWALSLSHRHSTTFVMRSMDRSLANSLTS